MASLMVFNQKAGPRAVRCQYQCEVLSAMWLCLTKGDDVIKVACLVKLEASRDLQPRHPLKPFTTLNTNKNLQHSIKRKSGPTYASGHNGST